MLDSEGTFPGTRAAALARWQAFLPQATRYGAMRNQVVPGHPHVTRLSPAVRARLVTTEELVGSLLETCRFEAVEKLVQELVWRDYWKGWLELRPSVWSDYRAEVDRFRRQADPALLRRAEAVMAGQGGIAVLDGFTRELIATGYLHNHARMWWAGYWIHVERLPWALGADFFYRHLLDADPASNTLSWRWVAGLQTPGKTYLVRLSNLEKYANGELLRDRRGSHRIADGAVTPSLQQEHADTSKRPLPEFPTSLPARAGRRGLWLHADDLAPEIGPLAEFAPDAVAAFTSERTYREHYRLSENRIAALRTVLGDGIARAAAHYRCPATLYDADDTAAGIVAWARSQQLTEVVGFTPTVGPVGDLIPRLSKQLAGLGIRLTLIQRESDAPPTTATVSAAAVSSPVATAIARDSRETDRPVSTQSASESLDQRRVDAAGHALQAAADVDHGAVGDPAAAGQGLYRNRAGRGCPGRAVDAA